MAPGVFVVMFFFSSWLASSFLHISVAFVSKCGYGLIVFYGTVHVLGGASFACSADCCFLCSSIGGTYSVVC